MLCFGVERRISIHDGAQGDSVAVLSSHHGIIDCLSIGCCGDSYYPANCNTDASACLLHSDLLELLEAMSLMQGITYGKPEPFVIPDYDYGPVQAAVKAVDLSKYYDNLLEDAWTRDDDDFTCALSAW